MGCCLLHGHHLNLNEQIWLSGYCQEACHSADTDRGLSKTEGWKKKKTQSGWHGHNPKSLTRYPLKATLRAWERWGKKIACQQRAKHYYIFSYSNIMSVLLGRFCNMFTKSLEHMSPFFYTLYMPPAAMDSQQPTWVLYLTQLSKWIGSHPPPFPTSLCEFLWTWHKLRIYFVIY